MREIAKRETFGISALSVANQLAGEILSVHFVADESAMVWRGAE